MPGPSAPRGYYKPALLRCPSLGALMVVLLVALCVLVALQYSMPDSDDSAVVDGRPLARSVAPAADAVQQLAGQGPVGDAGNRHDFILAPRNLGHFRRQARDTAIEPLTASQPSLSLPNSAQESQLVAISEAPTLPNSSADNTSPAPPGTLITTTHPITTSRKRLPKPPKGSASYPSGPGAVPSPPETPGYAAGTATPTVPTTYTTTISDFINRSSSVFAQPGPTTVTEIAVSAADIGPTLRTDIVITGGTTTAIAIIGTVTPPSRTTTDSAGSTIVVSPLPVETTQTVTGVLGGYTVQTVRIDDGLTAETNTITATVDGALVTLLAVSTPGQPTTETLASVVGGAAVVVTPPPKTIVSDLGSGVPTTITSEPAPYVTTTGGVTTTLVLTKTPGRVVTTYIATTANGTPTTMETVITITPTTNAPPSGNQSGSGDTQLRVLPGFTTAQYLAFTYLPTIIAACLAVPFSIITTNAKLMQPFHTLATRRGGGSGSDTLTLSFGGRRGVTSSLTQVFRRGEFVPLLASLGAGLSSLLAPLAAEAVSFKVHGSCTHLDIAGCGIAPGISPGPMHALVALTAALLVLLGVLALVLRRWETGVHADPWSLAAVASLSLNSSLRERFDGELSEAELKERLRDGRFRLDMFNATAADGVQDESEGEVPYYEYGIVPVEDPVPVSSGLGTTTTATVTAKASTHVNAGRHSRCRHMPFVALTYTSRIIFATALLGLIALLAYYYQPLDDNAFELFMDSQAFGVKFLFALLGSAIAGFWRSFFKAVAAASPFARMERRPRTAAQSIVLHSPATNSVSGVAAGVRQRDALLLAASLMAGTVELLLPALLANVPYTLTQTYAGHAANSAATLVVLAAMVAVQVASLVFVRWPHLPVDPRTLAGAIYYVAGSARLRDNLRGRRLALQSRTSRDAEVEELDLLYSYGQVGGPGGSARMGVKCRKDREKGGYT